MDLVEAITTQRAIRRLKPDPVDDDVLTRILELAIKAPTGGNAQGWEWIMVRDREVKSALGKQLRRAWRFYGGAGRRATRGVAKVQGNLAAVECQEGRFDVIPIRVIACLHVAPPAYHWHCGSSRWGSVFAA